MGDVHRFSPKGGKGGVGGADKILRWSGNPASRDHYLKSGVRIRFLKFQDF